MQCGLLHLLEAKLAAPQPHRAMSSWSAGGASRRSGLQLALRPPDSALLPATWCHAGYKTIYNQAPCLQALQATKQTKNVTALLQPPKWLLCPSPVERSPWKPPRPDSRPLHSALHMYIPSSATRCSSIKFIGKNPDL